MDERPSEHTSPLGRDMPCPNCGCVPFHHMRCGGDLGNGVICPCRGVPTPGVKPAA